MQYRLKAPIDPLFPKQANAGAWWKSCVIYQIYPRSFQDSNADGNGDLQGIINRLDYLSELDIDALWLSPIYPSPMADCGYDVSNYRDIDPLFGSLEIFDRLLEAAHQRELKIILDYVANHSSDQHPWFIQSRSSRHHPMRDWYIWRDAKENGEPPNNWPSFFGGSAWTWDEPTQQYYLHLFLPEQPDLNWRNSEVAAAMKDVLRFWLDRGVDGFRMDAATTMVKHPDLPDIPPHDGWQHANDLLQRLVYAHNQPELHDVLRAFRQLFDGYPGHRVILGETGELDPHKLISFYGANLDELHLPFNFIPMHTPWRAAEMKQAISSYYEALPQGATPNFVFGSHDVSRPATRYGPENHRSVAMLLLTLAGAATLYYGDELGMTDGDVPPEKVCDPAALHAGSSVPGRDPARTPMPWNAETNAGFTAINKEPWLPLANNYRTVNVAHQDKNPRSTLNFYRQLLALRRQSSTLQQGSLAFVEGAPDDVLVYLRQHDGNRLLIIINFADQAFQLDLSQVAARVELHLSTAFTALTSLDIKQTVVKAHESLLLQLD